MEAAATHAGVSPLAMQDRNMHSMLHITRPRFTRPILPCSASSAVSVRRCLALPCRSLGGWVAPCSPSPRSSSGCAVQRFAVPRRALPCCAVCDALSCVLLCCAGLGCPASHLTLHLI
jgi:hypothetical protein